MDSESDGEFERSKAGGTYTTSSASAVTAAAAAMLASSRLSKSHKRTSKSKSNGTKKSGKKPSKTQLSDSEEPPPSYYDDYSTGRGGVLEDSSTDPYAFDMTSTAFSTTLKREKDYDEEHALKKKKKNDELKTLAKKVATKSAPISMEDRIAEILKRTGSAQFQVDEKSDEDEVSDKESDVKKATEPSARKEEESLGTRQEQQSGSKNDNKNSNIDAERSSLSDSLGVVSADFEVHLPLKPIVNRTRLSLLTFLKSEQDADSITERTEIQEPEFYLSASAEQKPLDASDTFGYGDDEFEETERSRQEEVIPVSEDQEQIAGTAQDDASATSDVEYNDDYEDDAFEGSFGSNTKFSTNQKCYLCPCSKLYNTRGLDWDCRITSLCTLILRALGIVLTLTKLTLWFFQSPPPPPPPADEDFEDQELQKFSLNAPVIGSKAQVQSAVQQSTSTATTQYLRPLSAADKFRRIETQVASLHFIQPGGTPSLTAADSPSAEGVHPVSSNFLASSRASVGAPPPFIEPIAISFDAGLLTEDDDTQREIDEYVRSSQILRQEKRVVAQRASLARENGLVLRLQQAQRQILQLKEHIQATASETSQPGRDSLNTSKAQADKLDSEDILAARGESSHNISQAAYRKLQQEIKTQDNLIAAFQKENERLMGQLKQVRQDVHYDVHKANEELRRQVKKLQDQLGEVATLGGGGDLTSKAQYRVAVEGRLEAEAHAMALQEELAGVRLSYQQKLNEITLELDRVKKAKVELECRYEGVDLTQVAQEAQHAQQLQSELELSKKEHSHALAALQKKLDWYVENQRLLDHQDEELRRLRRQVASQPPDPTPSKDQKVHASPARSHRRSSMDIRRIQELESRLAELEEAMRRRHPDSLANLILASRRADAESKTRALEQDYQEKLAALSRELEQAHESNETKLASFRQQQEKLLLQYKRKIKELEKQLKQLSKAPLSHRPTSKDSVTSEAELTKIRRFYTDKIKELERKWEAKYRSLRKQQYSGLSSNQQEGLTYAGSTVVIANLQRQIREQELELKQEKAKVEQLEAEIQLANTPDDSSAVKDDKQKELEDQVADLKAQLEDSESARARLAQTLTTVQTLGLARALNSQPTSVTKSSIVSESAVSKQIEAELAQLKHDLDATREILNSERETATKEIDRLKQQVAEYIEKNAALEAQLAGNQREMQSLEKLALEAERHNRSLEAQAQRVPDLEEEVLALRRELQLPHTPSMVQYRSLELQVATLEQKHKLREAELKVVLDRALTSTHLEQLSRERAHQASIAAKNAEIASFKLQLEEILDELAQLQQPSSPRLPCTKPLNQSQDNEDVAW
ncbi:T-complex protein 1 subunit epsilon [Phytophthora nicotianae]|uniref:Centrosomal protein of 162 kDa n=1 Tax=Phytophthora nicotianae TaxID=4792 RepID=A0A0W8DDL7_PHYNI|nr:T-complex protein 1 subunit epsilon [Phytophthora nicotianae]